MATVLFIMKTQHFFFGCLCFIISKDKTVLSGAALFSFRDCPRLCNSKIIATIELDGFDGGGHEKPVEKIRDPVSFGKSFQNGKEFLRLLLQLTYDG